MRPPAESVRLVLIGLAVSCQMPLPDDLVVVETAGQTADEDLLREVARTFYADHADDYDMLVLWGGADLAPYSSYYYPVRNDVAGIGYDHVGPERFDHSAEFGSARLQGIIWLGPDWRTNRSVGPRSVPGILLQETGHRWAASVYFESLTAKGGISTDLLADPYHWSFFFDTGGSPLGGNQWSAIGDGRFVATPVDRVAYCPLDLYLMGLLDATAVGPLTLLTDLRDDLGRPSAAFTRASPTVTGEVTVRATVQTVSADAIIAVEGRREPSTSAAPRQIRQAWIYVGNGAPSASELDHLATLQAAWPEQFELATGGLATISSDL